MMEKKKRNFDHGMVPHIFTVQSSKNCSNNMSQYQCTALTHRSKQCSHPCPPVWAGFGEQLELFALKHIIE